MICPFPTCTRFCLGSCEIGRLAEQVDKIQQHHKTESTQPNYLTWWTSLYRRLFGRFSFLLIPLFFSSNTAVASRCPSSAGASARSASPTGSPWPAPSPRASPPHSPSGPTNRQSLWGSCSSVVKNFRIRKISWTILSIVEALILSDKFAFPVYHTELIPFSFLGAKPDKTRVRGVSVFREEMFACGTRNTKRMPHSTKLI